MFGRSTKLPYSSCFRTPRPPFLLCKDEGTEPIKTETTLTAPQKIGICDIFSTDKLILQTESSMAKLVKHVP